MNNILVSPNFKLKEFECRDGSHQVVLHSELLEKLQALRSALGRPVIINSGYRNPEHNKRVGGSPTSLHMQGMAADIRVPGMSPQELAKAAREVGFRGIGNYTTFLHVDIRQDKKEWKG